MFNIIRIADARASARAFGYPVLGFYKTIAPIDRNCGPVLFVEPGQPQGQLSPLPPEVDEFLIQNLPVRSRGEYVTEPQQIKRRLAAVGTPSTVLEYRRAMEAFALSPAWLHPSPERDAAAACEGALYHWDSEGQRLDMAAKETEERLAREAAEREEAERLAKEPNTKPFSCIFIPDSVRVTALPLWIWPNGAGPDDRTLAWMTSPAENGRVLYCPLPDAGLEWFDTQVEDTPCQFLSSYVPKVAPPKSGYPRFETHLFDLRGAEGGQIKAFRDLRTVDGESADRQLRRWAKPRIDKLTSKEDNVRITWNRMFAQVAVRGLGLLPALVASTYREVVGKGQGVTDERMSKMLAEAAKGGGISWVSPEELFEVPSEGILTKFANVFVNDDAWREVLDAETHGKTAVEGKVLIRALQAKGLVDSPPATEDYQRLNRLMAAWRAGQFQIDGKRVRGFARTVA